MSNQEARLAATIAEEYSGQTFSHPDEAKVWLTLKIQQAIREIMSTSLSNLDKLLAADQFAEKREALNSVLCEPGKDRLAYALEDEMREAFAKWKRLKESTK